MKESKLLQRLTEMEKQVSMHEMGLLNCAQNIAGIGNEFVLTSSAVDAMMEVLGEMFPDEKFTERAGEKFKEIMERKAKEIAKQKEQEAESNEPDPIIAG